MDKERGPSGNKVVCSQKLADGESRKAEVKQGALDPSGNPDVTESNEG